MDNGHTRKSLKVLLVLAFISSVMFSFCLGNAAFAAKAISDGLVFKKAYYDPRIKGTTIEIIDRGYGNTTTTVGVPGNIGDDQMDPKKIGDKIYFAVYEQTSYGKGKLMVCYEIKRNPLNASPVDNNVCIHGTTNTNTNTNTNTSTNTATNTNTGKTSSTVASTTTSTTGKKTSTNSSSSSKSSGSSSNSSSNQSKVDTGASGPSGAVESDVCKQSNIPEAVKLAAGCSVTVDGEQKTAPNIQNVIMGIINGVIAVLGIICVAVIIYGGIRYMTSVGEQEKVKKAKNTILYAVIGLAICALSFAITNFVVGVLNGETSTSTSQSNSSNSKDAGNSNSGSKKEKKNSSSDSNKEDNNESNSDDDSASESGSIDDLFVYRKFDVGKNGVHAYTDENGRITAIEMQGIRGYYDFGTLEFLFIEEDDNGDTYILAVSLDLTSRIYPVVMNGEILIRAEFCQNKVDGECWTRDETKNVETGKTADKENGGIVGATGIIISNGVADVVKNAINIIRAF